MNFYAVIIGTEILNARREDKHFSFLREQLSKFGHTLHASFVVKDDKQLMIDIYNLVKNDKNSIMFSFGGIGSTPDDLTREIAAQVFTKKDTKRDKQFEKDIIDKFGKDAYPHRIHMADLPENSELLFNPVNNMSGFSLYKRYFFVPGFPSMAHPMIEDVINKYFSKKTLKYRFTLLAQTSENDLIEIMQEIPSDIELSSLPMFKDSKPAVELSLIGKDEKHTKKYFNLFVKELETQKKQYILI